MSSTDSLQIQKGIIRLVLFLEKHGIVPEDKCVSYTSNSEYLTHYVWTNYEDVEKVNKEGKYNIITIVCNYEGNILAVNGYVEEDRIGCLVLDSPYKEVEREDLILCVASEEVSY